MRIKTHTPIYALRRDGNNKCLNDTVIPENTIFDTRKPISLNMPNCGAQSYKIMYNGNVRYVKANLVDVLGDQYDKSSMKNFLGDDDKVKQEVYSNAARLNPMPLEDTTMVVAGSDYTTDKANQQYKDAKKAGFKGNFTQFLDWAKQNDVLGKSYAALLLALGGGQGTTPPPPDEDDKMKKILIWSAVGLVVVVAAGIVIYQMNKKK